MQFHCRCRATPVRSPPRCTSGPCSSPCTASTSSSAREFEEPLMPDGAIDLRLITSARGELADARSEATAAAAERAAVASEFDTRVRAGEGGEPLRALERQIEGLVDR